MGKGRWGGGVEVMIDWRGRGGEWGSGRRGGVGGGGGGAKRGQNVIADSSLLTHCVICENYNYTNYPFGTFKCNF